MALIDEADSILLDEARVPLILSVAREDARQRAMLWQTVALPTGSSRAATHLRAEQRRRNSPRRGASGWWRFRRKPTEHGSTRAIATRW